MKCLSRRSDGLKKEVSIVKLRDLMRGDIRLFFSKQAYEVLAGEKTITGQTACP